MIAPHEIAPSHIGAGLASAIRGMIPVLETARLTLRPMEMGDFPCLVEIVNGPGGDGVGGPQSREDTWFDFAQMMATWTWRGHGYWTAARHDDPEALGFVGIGFEPGDQEPELGYMFAEKERGQGFATEAARAALRFARSHLGLSSVVSYIHVGNTASATVAERLGATRDSGAEAALPENDKAWVYRHDLTRGATQ